MMLNRYAAVIGALLKALSFAKEVRNAQRD
jgi:hypothetical protein